MINRFEWLKAVLQSDLLDRAKVMASALAIQFGNDETGQINPSLDTLCSYLRMSEDTARRALSDLINEGWLARTVGLGRGNRSAYALLSPGSVVAMRPTPVNRKAVQKVARTPAEKVARVRPMPSGKGRTGAAKRSHGCTPPYKDEQSFEQKKGTRPTPHLRALVKAGSDAAAEWTAWLNQHDQPALEQLDRLRNVDGYCLTTSRPPSAHDPIATRVALNLIEWAKAEEMGHVHAA